MSQLLTTTTRTVAWFREHHENESLVIQPVFQRNPVWTDAQKSYLIDSILSGYPIPELYLQEVVDEEGSETQTIVDGQQRVRACLSFIAGQFRINTRLDTKSNWHGLAFDDLSGSDKKTFFSYRFVVRYLPEMSPSSLREIFMRLNRVVEALNDQELRHATYWGPFIRCIEGDLADNDFWGNSGIFTAHAIRRMKDAEYVSELAIAVLHGPQNKKDTLDGWYQTYEKGFDEAGLLKEVFQKVIGEIEQALPEIRATRWRKRSDLYTLFTVLAKNHSALPLASDVRSHLGNRLKLISKQVDFFMEARGESSMEDEVNRIPDYIREYVRGVERAASDVANRRLRMRALEQALAPIFPLSETWENERFTGLSGQSYNPADGGDRVTQDDDDDDDDDA